MNPGVSAARPKSNLHSLDPSVEGTGPHGLTVRIVLHVLRPNASIATRLTSGDEWPSRATCRGGVASLNHNFFLSERRIFLPSELDSSGKTGGGFLVARRVAAARSGPHAGSQPSESNVAGNSIAHEQVACPSCRRGNSRARRIGVSSADSRI